MEVIGPVVPSEVMEGVEGLMGKLKLSEAEKGGVQIGGSGGGHKSWIKEPQAVGKVLMDRLISPETLERSLGKVWCPIRGVTCKDLGRTIFLLLSCNQQGNRGCWRMDPG
jgi:hypothetical protein